MCPPTTTLNTLSHTNVSTHNHSIQHSLRYTGNSITQWIHCVILQMIWILWFFSIYLRFNAASQTPTSQKVSPKNMCSFYSMIYVIFSLTIIELFRLTINFMLTIIEISSSFVEIATMVKYNPIIVSFPQFYISFVSISTRFILLKFLSNISFILKIQHIAPFVQFYVQWP